MIVVTGPGRSGTSFVAGLYRELGFDPGGEWYTRSNAGYEALPFVDLNVTLANELGLSIMQRRGGWWAQRLWSMELRVRHLPEAVRPPARTALETARYVRAPLDLMEWDRLPHVVDHYGQAMRDLAASTAVVKDPRFTWTMPAWLAAGADVSAVVLTLRTLDAMADSRVRAKMYSGHVRDWAKHNYAYAIGLLLSSSAEHRVPVTTLRFPDFLEDVDALHRELPLPEPRSAEDFSSAFHRLFDPALVHDSR